ncbi:MAG: SDR family oxidoreductase [Saprospiraceae bacterium]|nr:SDR family oxidoreductase [Saprospiraceae bacterium]
MNKQKISIITGGASGIGFAIAEKFTQRGIFTYIIGRNQEKLEEACQALGENCVPIVFDMTKLDLIPGLVQTIAEKHGAIDILINNAGINLKKPMVDVSNEDFQNIILTNLTSVFALTREVVKTMIPRGNGNIINISSMAAHYGLPLVIAYTASKSGVEGMTRAMAVELSPLGIRVNCIAPGFILTKMSAAALNGDPQRKERVLSRTPMGKLGTPEDVANAAYFLVTDEAGFMTGTVIPVDGGNSIGF